MIFTVVLGFLLTVPASFGQTAGNNQLPDWVGRVQQKRADMDQRNGKTSNGMIANRQDGRIWIPHRTNPDAKPYTREEIERIEALLKPDEADSEKYKDFLKHSKTGLFRLFNFLDCETKNMIRVDGDCANYIPGSGLYSFREKRYSDTTFFDLKFKEDLLVSGSTLSLGILTSLGDVGLESVSLASDGMKYLAQLKPETEQKESEKQIAQFVRGLDADGYKYSSKIKIEENKTYGLRVVAYRMPRKVTLKIDSEDLPAYPYLLNESTGREDIIVTFRIVRRDADNISILWKELRRRDAPIMRFPKDVKVVTVKSNSD